MPKTIKNEDGSEEEVYTADELKVQQDAAIEEFKKANPDKAGEIAQLQIDLKAAQEALASGGGPNGANFEILRRGVEKLEKELDKVRVEADQKVSSIRDGMSDTALETAVTALAGEDAELAKKVRFHFKESLKNVKAETTEEFKNKIKNAYLLAAGAPADPNLLSGSTYGSGGSGPGPTRPGGGGGGGGGVKLKPELVDMGKRFFGLVEDDFTKYDKQDFSTTK